MFFRNAIPLPARCEEGTGRRLSGVLCALLAAGGHEDVDFSVLLAVRTSGRELLPMAGPALYVSEGSGRAQTTEFSGPLLGLAAREFLPALGGAPLSRLLLNCFQSNFFHIGVSLDLRPLFVSKLYHFSQRFVLPVAMQTGYMPPYMASKGHTPYIRPFAMPTGNVRVEL